MQGTAQRESETTREPNPTRDAEKSLYSHHHEGACRPKNECNKNDERIHGPAWVISETRRPPGQLCLAAWHRGDADSLVCISIHEDPGIWELLQGQSGKVCELGAETQYCSAT